jgi:hypothetical protein
MSKDVAVVDLVAELQRKNDFESTRAAEEIVRLRGVIARTSDPKLAKTDGDRVIVEVAKKCW